MMAARLSASTALVVRLTERARRIAEARVEARRSGERRWRRARLLWPLFAGER